MLISKPTYYDRFRCVAGSCPDSCCKEWDVQVDAGAAAYYRSLPGSLGDRLRQVLVTQADGSAAMTIVEGRCPMWRQDGLCRIQAELGEAALCHVCREFPRLTHDYGNFIEYGLELSCPEAARLILADREFQVDSVWRPGGGEPEYDQEAMETLLHTRETALDILRDSTRSLPEALRLLLHYGYQAQNELDGAGPAPFDPDAALDTAARFAKPGSRDAIAGFFSGLEILTPDWQALLNAPEGEARWPGELRAMAGYLVRRYWLQAVSDYDLACRVKFIIIACLLVKHLGRDVCRTAQLFSKEIENNTDNVDAILDAAYTNPAFTDAKLLGMLL